jgi:hypothetical protein
MIISSKFMKDCFLLFYDLRPFEGMYVSYSIDGLW